MSSPGALLLNTGSLCAQSWGKKKGGGGASKVKRRGGTPPEERAKPADAKSRRLLAAACNLLIQRDERRWSADGRTGSYRPCEEPVREDGGGGSRGNARPPNEVTLAQVLKVKWGYHARPSL